jgi:hypothetical protein
MAPIRPFDCRNIHNNSHVIDDVGVQGGYCNGEFSSQLRYYTTVGAFGSRGGTIFLVAQKPQIHP